jgi:GT2 family glycosyltransferase/glycosyltransferase involved in cell wall biosynthesis
VDPHPLFDAAFYCSRYPDVEQSGGNPLFHFVSHGEGEGRVPHPLLDVSLASTHATDPGPVNGRGSAGPTGAVERTPRLERPVTVIVPVYDGLEAVQALVRSLEATHPRPEDLLRFLFIDDGSPDPRVARHFRETSFYQRPDVSVERNRRNLGFVRTVNRGLRLADPSGDVLLLNSDTEVYGDAIRILQKVALRFPRIASLTPLTNNGTIASVVNWPQGGPLPFGLAPETVTRVVESLRIPTHPCPVPTGIGFCMYMTREALDAVGVLDEEAFGRGYGEENDWCQRAAQSGFVNLICTETFVYHLGTQSFASDEKRALQERAMRELRRRHPGYLPSVRWTVRADTLRAVRCRVLWELSRVRKAQHGYRTLTMVLHNDPDCSYGGTERHVKMLSACMTRDAGFEVLLVFPGAADTACVRLVTADGSGGVDFAFSQVEFAETLDLLLKESDVVHVHHVKGWSPSVLESIVRAPVRRKLFTVHDFTVLCPSATLLDGAGVYCGLPNLEEVCNRCLAEVHGYEVETMQAYRSRMLRFLDAFDAVLIPSPSVRDVLFRGLGAFDGGRGPGLADLAGKVRVLSHGLPFRSDGRTENGRSSPGSALEKRLVFLGAIGLPKGARLILESLDALEAAGFCIEVWGKFDQPEQLRGRVDIWSYEDHRELIEHVQQRPPFLVCLPSVVPETFAYTLYEALALTRVPVVVGPFGNPGDVVGRLGVGQVMTAPTADALLHAIEEASTHYAEHVRQLDRHLADVIREGDLGRYVGQLTSLYGSREAAL